MLFDLLFDSLSQAEKGLRSRVQSTQDRLVRTGEIIGRGIVYVRVKIRKDTGDVMAERPAVNASM